MTKTKEELAQEIEALKVSLSKARAQLNNKNNLALRKQTTQTSSNYHKSVSLLIEKVEDFRARMTDDDIVSIDENATIVITDAFDAEIVAFAQEAFKNFRK